MVVKEPDQLFPDVCFSHKDELKQTPHPSDSRHPSFDLAILSLQSRDTHFWSHKKLSTASAIFYFHYSGASVMDVSFGGFNLHLPNV